MRVNHVINGVTTVDILSVKKASLNQRQLSTLCFALFGGWLLAVAFQGQILSLLMETAGITSTTLFGLAIPAHFLGLFSCGFLIKQQLSAKVTMVAAVVVCLAGSLIFFLPFSILWHIALVSISCFAGLFVASWAFYFKSFSRGEQRFQTVADVLIAANVLMIIFNVTAVHVSPFLGLSLTLLALLGALLLAFRLDGYPPSQPQQGVSMQNTPLLWKSMVVLCLFIFLFTLNSGLMYQVVVPSFSQHSLLTTYYWAVPYIFALLVLRNMPHKVSKAYILYAALAMMGLSFIFFVWLDTSISSFIIVNTLMLAAFGVGDLFWWSIIGAIFDHSANPAQIFGIGMSANVLGIFCGGVLGSHILSGRYVDVTLLALMITFVVIMVLPILNARLSQLLKDHVFLVEFKRFTDNEEVSSLPIFVQGGELTEKEVEIVGLLLKGFTYKGISDALFITENTTKYHIKNIYQKLNVKNKMELIKRSTSYLK